MFKVYEKKHQYRHMILLIEAPTRKSKKGKRKWSVTSVSFWGEGIGLQKYKVENDYAKLRHCGHVRLCKSPLGHSPPGSSVCEVLQATIPEWVAKSSSRGSSQPRGQTRISMSPALADRFFTIEPPGKPREWLLTYTVPYCYLTFFFFNYCILWKVWDISGKTSENNSKIE